MNLLGWSVGQGTGEVQATIIVFRAYTQNPPTLYGPQKSKTNNAI